MVLEAIVVCVDNSSWMRNGDYIPTRLESQNEAVNYLSSIKTQSNPETTVGVLAMAGKRIEVLLTLTRDLGQIMNALHGLRAEGECNFISGLKTAQLVLKNRQNKNQKQRVIMFCGSPVTHETKKLERVAKNMKKNNIAVDVINFGDENTENKNTEKLEAFVKAVNSGDNSKLVNIPPGPHNLSDMIVSSILSESGGGAGGAGAMGGAGAAAAAAGFGGVDPNVDPELALALRMSMEEERARQEQQSKDETPQSDAAAAQSSGGGEAQADDSSSADKDEDMPDLAEAEEDEDDEEQALLAEAIALSMAENDDDDDVEMESPPEDDKPKEQEPADDKPKDSEERDEVAETLNDPDFLHGLVESLGVEGLDVNEIVNQSIADEDKDKDKDNASGS